jgi:hypothetical protein
MSIFRNDYDPSNNISFIKVDKKKDIKPINPFNRKTNYYDFIRKDYEQEAPLPRDYDMEPTMDRSNLFETEFEKNKQKALLLQRALNKELILPVLDDNGNPQTFQDNTNIIKRPYKFDEILYGSETSLKKYALEYLNSLQEIEFGQTPEYVLMLDLLDPSGKKQRASDTNYDS